MGVAQLLSVGLQASRKRIRGSFPLGMPEPTEVVPSFMLTVEQGNWLKGDVYIHTVRKKSLLLHNEAFWEERELPRLTLSDLVGLARDFEI